MDLEIWSNPLLNMRYYIIAGEPSGDLHGSNLMKAIKREDPSAEFNFWGGDHMLSVDTNIVTHIRETSIMGFVEVAKNISKISTFFKVAKASIVEFQPDRIVLIDYPGFNLRMAEWGHKKGFHIYYYISPQLWAWKKGRIKKVQNFVDEMIVILPFEEEFYKKQEVKAHYVGHPLVPVIQTFEPNNAFKQSLKVGHKKILALLPGSRKQEITKMLPIFIEAARAFKEEFHIVLAAAPNQGLEFYRKLIPQSESISIIENDTYNLLHHADLAIVTSGTATLETALFKVPQVVCYKTSSLNYQIGKRLVDLKYISLVNLILDEHLVQELIQDDVNQNNIKIKMHSALENSQEMIDGYNRLSDILSQNNSPSSLAAKIIIGRKE